MQYFLCSVEPNYHLAKYYQFEIKIEKSILKYSEKDKHLKPISEDSTEDFLKMNSTGIRNVISSVTTSNLYF